MPPLVFEPRYWNRLWGGRSLETQFGRHIPDGLVGESWEVSTHPQHLSRVAAGPFAGRTLKELWDSHRADLSGRDDLPQSSRFPLLIKLLDCQQPLSVQVHPNGEQAARHCPHENGKSEAWVVLDANADSRLLAGFKPGVARDEIIRSLNAGRINECLHELHPSVGDCILIPSGVPHAILGPLVLLEVQPTSDATFRLFDWNRVDLNGQPRQLHIDESLAVIDWQCGPISPSLPVAITTGNGVTSSRLLASAEFNIDRHCGAGVLDVAYSSLSVWVVISGRTTLSDNSGFERTFVAGETVLIPARHELARWHITVPTELIAATPPM